MQGGGSGRGGPTPVPRGGRGGPAETGHHGGSGGPAATGSRGGNGWPTATGPRGSSGWPIGTGPWGGGQQIQRAPAPPLQLTRLREELAKEKHHRVQAEKKAAGALFQYQGAVKMYNNLQKSYNELHATKIEETKRLNKELEREKQRGVQDAAKYQGAINTYNNLQKSYNELHATKIEEPKRLKEELEREKQHGVQDATKHREAINGKDNEYKKLEKSYNELHTTKKKETKRLNEELEREKQRGIRDAKKHQEAIKGKENKYNDLLKSYNELKRMKSMAEVYGKYRQWIEDQSSSSYDRIKLTVFSSAELHSAVNNPKRMLLGTGRYGHVYKSTTGQMTVAIKIPNESLQRKQEFNQEVDILKRIRHPNLVTLIGACAQKHALVYEFLSNGTLEDRLAKKETAGSFSWEERVRIASSICSALVFLHSSKPAPIIHGDLKSSNVLFDEESICKLGDFGMSRLLQRTCDPYTDPDSFASHGSTESDVLALGIILLQLVTGQASEDLREYVLRKLGDFKIFQQNNIEWQRKVLIKGRIVDAKLDEWATEDAVKMVLLGLGCSDPVPEQRPDLAADVWIQIESMKKDRRISHSQG